MDANQFQTGVVAWCSAATVSIAAITGVVLAMRSAVNKVTAAVLVHTAAIATVTTSVAHVEKAVNGDLAPRVAAIADERIAAHRRPTDAK